MDKARTSIYLPPYLWEAIENMAALAGSRAWDLPEGEVSVNRFIRDLAELPSRQQAVIVRMVMEHNNRVPAADRGGDSWPEDQG